MAVCNLEEKVIFFFIIASFPSHGIIAIYLAAL